MKFIPNITRILILIPVVYLVILNNFKSWLFHKLFEIIPRATLGKKCFESGILKRGIKAILKQYQANTVENILRYTNSEKVFSRYSFTGKKSNKIQILPP